MSILKYIDRLKRMDDLIRRKATGNSEEFARKLKISRSVLMENIRELKELGATVDYSATHRSYFYQTEFTLIIGAKNRSESFLKGGVDVLKKMVTCWPPGANKCFKSGAIGLCLLMFDV